MPINSDLSLQTFLALMDRLQDAAFVIKNGYFCYINQSVVDLFRTSEEELLKQPVFDLIHEEDREFVQQRYMNRLGGQTVENEYDFRINSKEGKTRTVKMKVGLAAEPDGTLCTIGSLHDITDLENTKNALAKSKDDLASILLSLPDIFYQTDINGIITLISPSVYDALGYTSNEMIGRPLHEFYRKPNDRQRIINALVEGNGQARNVEAWLLHKDGTPVWMSTNAHIRHDKNGEPVYVEGIARERTEQKLLDDRLSFLAKYDPLTTFYNRRSFFEECNRLLGIAQRYNRPFSLIMLDLDWFKSINDKFGHQVGDDALIHFSEVCRGIYRETDIVGRIGGEEFVILSPETEPHNAIELIKRFKSALSQNPLDKEGAQIFLTFSAGLVSMSEQDESIESLFKRADQLLYQAKSTGRNKIVIEDGSEV
ncbi:MAG: diguanylate cyclase [Candidatus Thiodiazotropha sp.]